MRRRSDSGRGKAVDAGRASDGVDKLGHGPRGFARVDDEDIWRGSRDGHGCKIAGWIVTSRRIQAWIDDEVRAGDQHRVAVTRRCLRRAGPDIAPASTHVFNVELL